MPIGDYYLIVGAFVEKLAVAEMSGRNACAANWGWLPPTS